MTASLESHLGLPVDVRALIDVPTAELMVEAARLRDRAHGARVTFSPKVFIPLTMLCRDKCGYCTFAKPPAHLVSPYLELDEVLAIARRGAELGCHEALFTLGEAPEERYPDAAAWLGTQEQRFQRVHSQFRRGQKRSPVDGSIRALERTPPGFHLGGHFAARGANRVRAAGVKLGGGSVCTVNLLGVTD